MFSAGFSPDLSISTALLGGALIGLSSAILLLFNGKIAGISGILGGMLVPKSGALNTDMPWRIVFIIALILGALIGSQLGIVKGQIREVASLPLALIAGIIVGVGTRFGGGCTSGHGICGMSRFSVRSFVAVGVFMVTGFITASLFGVWG